MNVSIDSKSLNALLDLEKDLETEYAAHAETRDKLYSNEDELRKLRNAIVEKNEEIWRLNDANEGKENLLQAFRKNAPSNGSSVQSMEVKIAYFRNLMVILRELENGNAEHKITAIKYIREITRSEKEVFNLRDAKGLIEEYQKR